MDYRSMTIHFMSGTGNSFRAATWMTEIANPKNIRSKLHQISRYYHKSDFAEESNELLGMVFPTHGFTAPWRVIRYALRLPHGMGKHAFVVPTRAGTRIASIPFPGLEGTAGYLIALILILKGYIVRGVMGLDMPSNWMSLHWGLNTTNSNFIIEISLAYLIVGRFFLSKLFFASSNCTGCGLCVKSCPVKAIRMLGSNKPRPYWSFTCESCMRCMGYCPNRAVEVSHSFAIVLYFIATLPVSFYLLNGMKNLIPMEHNIFLIEILFDYCYTLVSIFVAYLILYWIIKIPLLNKLCTYTTFTHFYRRYHEPDTALIDIVRESKND